MPSASSLLLAFSIASASPADVIERVEGWIETYAARPERTDTGDLERLDGLLAGVRAFADRSPGHATRAGGVVLDLCGAALEATSVAPARRRAWEVRDRAAETWSALPRAAGPFAVERVLAGGPGVPLPRRVAAAHLFSGSQDPATVRALLAAMADPDPGLTAAAADALVGTDRAEVHAGFLGLMRSEPPAPPAALAAAEAHFRSIRLGRKDPLQEDLARLALARLRSRDRREVASGVALSSSMRDELATPALLDALETWNGIDPKTGDRERARHDLRRALERRSGLRLGLEADPWRTWWSRGGHRTNGAAAETGRTRAGFFGLQPDSTRVTFALDRSGSMGLACEGPSGEVTTRFEAALRQMESYLDAMAPGSRFNLVLFADGAERWSSDLEPVTPTRVRAALSWARRRSPEGGTQLRHGLEKGFGLRSDGTLPLGGPPADTLVVLCDGRTDEGPGWIRWFLRRVNAEARVVVHGVQIGSAGDGSLELLARQTGGDFIGPLEPAEDR